MRVFRRPATHAKQLQNTPLPSACEALKLQRRGQGSVELIIVTTVVIILAVLFSSFYLGLQDSTMALLMAKSRITEKLNELQEPAIIEHISYQIPVAGTIEIAVQTVPASISGVNLSDVETEIENSTSFATVNIQLN